MSDNLIRYRNTYEGRALLETYSLSDERVWVVKGEDPNPDFGGCHSMPVLGYFQGKLSDVLEHAVNLPGFWQWGEGGSIEPISIVTILDFTAKDIKRLKDMEQDLASELEKVKRILKDYGM